MKPQPNKIGFTRCLILILQGMVTGSGAILPGISGGVLCVAFGVYEPMMALFSHPIRAFRQHYRIFMPFLFGWIGGFWLLAGTVSLFFEKASATALALFGGLIFGCIPGLMKKAQKADGASVWTPFVVTLALTFTLLKYWEGTAMTHVSPSIGWYVFCGVVWGLSMVLPGLSSSSILLFMGLYQPMTQGIANLETNVLFPLLAGLGLSLLLSARLVNFLLEHQYASMSKIILGIMIPPSLMILPTSFAGTMDIIVSAGAFAVGFFLAMQMNAASAKDTKTMSGKETE